MNISDVLPLLMLVAGLGWMMFLLMRRTRPRTAEPQVRQPKRASSDGLPLVDAPPDILRWQVAMQELARDLQAELDSKVAVLERLTLMADRACERLDTAISRAERAELSSTEATPGRPVEPKLQGASEPDSVRRSPWFGWRSEIRARATAGEPLEQIADQLGAPVSHVELLSK